jgi:hypothetical protein
MIGSAAEVRCRYGVLKPLCDRFVLADHSVLISQRGGRGGVAEAVHDGSKRRSARCRKRRVGVTEIVEADPFDASSSACR